jgi:LmbE family N-acetylglucosaminyl deacetylase
MRRHDTVRALFVSPHFDDVALSCGGQVSASVAAGLAPLIVTVFAGDSDPAVVPSALVRAQHAEHGDQLVPLRRREDEHAARILGASLLHLPFRDAIYRSAPDAHGLRTPLYATEEMLTGAPRREDDELAAAVEQALVALWQDTGAAAVHLPLAVAGHVDHRLCAMSGPALRTAGAAVFYYEDFPFSLDAAMVDQAVAAWGEALAPVIVDVTEHLDRRVRAIAAYETQVRWLFAPFADLGTLAEVTALHASWRAEQDGRYAERLWQLR